MYFKYFKYTNKSILLQITSIFFCATKYHDKKLRILNTINWNTARFSLLLGMIAYSSAYTNERILNAS